jgi:addiction module RelE/StbE family toxin
MGYEVVISKSADRDLDEILTYMAEKLANPQAASAFADELDRHYDTLARQPLIFEPSRHGRLREKGYRRFPVKNYLVFYTVDENRRTVHIARIFYGRQDYEKYL